MKDLKQIPRFETHTHSEYSNIRLLDSTNRLPELLTTAAELGMAGLTLTDHEAVCGHVQLLLAEKNLKEKEKLPKDFKVALGNEIYLTNTRTSGSQKYFHFILIAKNTYGYEALKKLSSIAWTNSYTARGKIRVPTLKSELTNILKEYPNSLIGCTACLGGELATLTRELNSLESQNADSSTIYLKKKEIADFIEFGKNLFGEDFYIEIAPGSSYDQITYNTRIKPIAEALKVKMIFATDAHYLKASNRQIHKIYLQSSEGEGEREVDAFYADAHLMDNEEAYSYLNGIYTEQEFISMCDNTIEIMNKIESYDIFRNPIIPEVKVPDSTKSIILPYEELALKKLIESNEIQERYWVTECLQVLENKKPWEVKSENIEKIKEAGGDIYDQKTYYDRLNIEAEVISHISDKLGDSLFKYFNTFRHYIDLFWECGSLCGPGRGSAVCFLSNYLLGITQLDPVRWNIDYWRFLNKERVELPDIDTDLSPSKRNIIFQRMREERGEDRVIQVCTFTTEKTRRAILSACRGYKTTEYPNGIDVDIAQYLTSLIPSERGFLWSLSDVVHGNKELDRKPIKAFISEVSKYDGLLDVMLGIEGLVCARGEHASGVILYNQAPYLTNALMRSASGNLTTQFSLHDSEAIGDVKFDFLVTEICDKISNAIILLQKDGYFSEDDSLRTIYESTFHPEVINLGDQRIWEAISSGNIMDIFQFNSSVGLQAAKAIKPKNPIELTMANALMRLMGEKNEERPIDRYIRLKENMSRWYEECKNYELSEKEIKILEKYYLSRNGVPALQEDLMLVCMDSNIANFTLAEANGARKIVAKKQMSKIPELKEKFISQCPNENFANYVWKTVMGPQMGYAFSLPHSLAYSFVAIQTAMLSVFYPSIYWNCACLITNSGGNLDSNFDEEIEEEDDADNTVIKGIAKEKVKNTDYGKISTAIGQMRQFGINVTTPNINKSLYTFSPDAETNTIPYGMKGIVRIGKDLVDLIIANRPYESFDDFIIRIKPTKLQAINLIKCGAFDCLGNRREIMEKYIATICKPKTNLTMANIPMLVEQHLMPQELLFESRVYFFNKALAKEKNAAVLGYTLNKESYNFFSTYFDNDNILYTTDTNQPYISIIAWDNIFKQYAKILREYIKAHKNELLAELNKRLWQEEWDKYCSGPNSKWEMDSVVFYSNEHELDCIDSDYYGVENFSLMPKEPSIDKVLNIGEKSIPIFKLTHIAGTVIDKDKNKNSVTLLTPDGVVTVKIFRDQFAKYNKQISKKLPDGKKKIIERSWFTRGNKIYVTGIRRGDTFILKKYKNTSSPLIALITSIDENGLIELKTEREEE